MAYLAELINPVAVNFGAVYLQFHEFIDVAIALLLFISICQWVFTKKYPGKEGKLIAIAVAIALTFAFAVFMLQTGFYFGHPIMQGLAGIIMLVIFGTLLYELLKNLFGEGGKICALAFTYFLMYGVFMTVFSPIYQHMHSYYPVVAAVLGLGFVIALVQVLICFFKMFSSMGLSMGGGGGPTGHGGHDDHAAHAHPAAPHAPHMPLAVQIVAPVNGQHFNLGEDIEVIGNINGGSGQYVWHFNTRAAQPFQNNTNPVHAMLHGLPLGTHRIEVTVEDGHGRAVDHVEIIVDAQTPGAVQVAITDPAQDGLTIAEGDATPVPVYGTVAGPANGATHYDYLFGIYTRAGLLHAQLPPHMNTPNGTRVGTDIDFTRVPLRGGIGQLPQGTYRIVLLAYAAGTAPQQIPGNLAALPRTAARAERVIIIGPAQQQPARPGLLPDTGAIDGKLYDQQGNDVTHMPDVVFSVFNMQTQQLAINPRTQRPWMVSGVDANGETIFYLTDVPYGLQCVVIALQQTPAGLQHIGSQATTNAPAGITPIGVITLSAATNHVTDVPVVLLAGPQTPPQQPPATPPAPQPPAQPTTPGSLPRSIAPPSTLPGGQPTTPAQQTQVDDLVRTFLGLTGQLQGIAPRYQSEGDQVLNMNHAVSHGAAQSSALTQPMATFIATAQQLAALLANLRTLAQQISTHPAAAQMSPQLASRWVAANRVFSSLAHGTDAYTTQFQTHLNANRNARGQI
jgi:hypothetical protein